MSASLPNLDQLIQTYGPTVIALLHERYPGWEETQPLTEGMIQTVDLEYKGKKSSKAGLVAGVLGLIALGYVATKE